MGCWDVYDIITGISASGGPSSFLKGEEQREKLADGLSDKIISAAQFPNIPTKQELVEIFLILLFCVSEDAEKEKVPFPDSSKHQPAVVIGKFREDEGDETVSIRICEGYDAYGAFDRVRGSDGEWKSGTTRLNDVSFPFTDYRCWHYMRAWVSLPSYSHKSLKEAFYDAFTNDLGGRAPGTSNSLQYGLMRFMWGQFQDSYLENCSIENALKYLCLDTAPNMSTAISQGLRGKELAPALFSDFQTWIFKTPDLWPYRSEAQSAAPIFRTFETALESTLMLLMLPMELILKIFSLLSLADIVTASSTCKSMRQLVTRPNIFPHLLHDLVTRPDGSLRWLQPCSLVKGEVDRANEALRTWVDVDPTNSVNPFSAPDFPFVEFVRTCLVKSDSMRNRQRIWGIIKQVEMILEIQDDAEDSDDSDEETDDDE